MNDSLKTLCKILNKYLAGLKELSKIIERKRDAIISLDFELLEKIVADEEKNLSEISKVEELFSEKFGKKKVVEIVLEQVKSGLAENDVIMRVHKLRDEVMREVENVKKLNNDIRFLLFYSLNFTRRLADALNSAKSINARI